MIVIYKFRPYLGLFRHNLFIKVHKFVNSSYISVIYLIIVTQRRFRFQQALHMIRFSSYVLLLMKCFGLQVVLINNF